MTFMFVCERTAHRCLGRGLTTFLGRPHVITLIRRAYAKSSTDRPAAAVDGIAHISSKKVNADHLFSNGRPLLFHRPSGQLIDLNADDVPLVIVDGFGGGGRKESNGPHQPAVISIPSVKNVELLLPNKVTVPVTNPNTSQKSLQAVDLNKQALMQLKHLPKCYMMLSKIRLTALVVLTEMGGYAMAPGVFDPNVFVLAALGTAGLSCAANTVNQFFEVPYDSQMNRTKNRVLVRGLISSQHAVAFAFTCATLGLATLHFGVNGITASLGCLNLILYTLVYTPMKRVTIANTWLGSIVGAIPPIMGWTACTGTLGSGGLLLGAILYAWQFPHFNALSWNLRGDYSRAGYQMMSVSNPDLCRRTSLRYSVVMLGLCSIAAPLVELTTWTFAIDSLPLNAYMIYLAWKFYRDADSASSRKLFRFSLVHLPAIMLLLLISKKHYGKKVDTDEADDADNVITIT